MSESPISRGPTCQQISTLPGAGAKGCTIQRRLSAFSQAHQIVGHEPSPTHAPIVRPTMAEIRRTVGMAPNQKAPELRHMMANCPEDTLAGQGDRVLLLIGFRRSELVALNGWTTPPRRAEQDGSSGRRPRGWHPLRPAPRDLSDPSTRCVAREGRHRRGSCVSYSQST